IGRRQAFECHARRRDAARPPAIDRTLGLRIHLGEIDCELGALDRDAHLDAQRLVKIAPVVIKQAFSSVDAIAYVLDDLTHRAIRLIPDLRDTGLDGRPAIAIEQFAVATRAELARRDLRAQVAETRLRKTDVVGDDLPQRFVAPTLLKYL